ncbi:unnamed protein product [Linum trigynum]|uniref:Uncharacterized protein n=1 Tax=Linum trigynum TaxID=586398 RepID=A0AAV2EH01_9ROSI
MFTGVNQAHGAVCGQKYRVSCVGRGGRSAVSVQNGGARSGGRHATAARREPTRSLARRSCCPKKPLHLLQGLKLGLPRFPTNCKSVC